MNGSSVTCVGLVCGLPNFCVAFRILFTFDIHIQLLFATNVVELAIGYYLKAGRACGVGCMLVLVRFMFSLNAQSISFLILQSVRVDHCERVQLIAAAKRISISNCRECVFFLGINQRPVLLGDNHMLQVRTVMVVILFVCFDFAFLRHCTVFSPSLLSLSNC